MIKALSRDNLISLMLVMAMFFASMTGIVFASQFIYTRGLLNVLLILLRFVFLTFGFLFVVVKKINKRWLFFISLYLFLITASGCIFPDNIPYVLKSFQKFIPMAFSTIMIMSIKDYSFFLELFYKTSIIVTFIVSLFIIYLFKTGYIFLFASEDTYMLFSYSILPFACCLLYTYSRKKTLFNLITFFVCSSIMTIFGCRGAILSLIGYFILIFFQKNILAHKYIKLVTIFSIVLILIVVLYINLSEINSLLKKEFGIHSRLLRKLSSSNQDLNSVSSGRLDIYIKVINELEQNPLSIRGVNADSVLIGGYCHNIFLELLYDFGLIIGSLLCTFILFFIAKTIFIKYETVLNSLILLFFAFGFIKLLVSSSLFYESYFWCWLMLFFKRLKMKFENSNAINSHKNIMINNV